MIVYFSGASGYTHRFVEKLELPARRIPLMTKDAKEFTVDDEYVLIVPTYGSKTQGYLPRQVKTFLNIPENRAKMIGVIGAGNTNFADEYVAAAHVIHKKTGVPIMYTFELAGTPEDVEKVKDGLTNLWLTRQSLRPAPQTSTQN